MRLAFWRRERTRKAGAPGPDDRIWGRGYTGPAPWVFGLIIAIVIAIASYLAFAKEIPFTGKGYELTATFENAATLRSTSPVRIAGVKVGEVTGVEAAGDAAKVTFTVDEQGRPIHDDAQVSIRPRLFLEGNFFLDLKPGSPSAPELPSDGEIPIAQTTTAVQLDEVLTTLQQPQRRGLQQLLNAYGTALTYQPTAADDIGQAPSVQGESAAEAINDSFRYGGDAGRGTAIVNTALRGENPGDLAGLIRGLGQTFGKLASRREELSELITNFNVFTGALAAESANLSRTIEELAPTLEEAEPSLAALSDALPAVRALAIESRPAIQELPETIAAGNPWLNQTRALLRRNELGELARLLKGAAPGLAQTTAASKGLFTQQTLLARCTSNVLIPTGDIVISDGASTGQPNYNEFLYTVVNLNGASQGFDGNGPYFRFQSGGGPQLVQGPVPGGTAGGTINFSNVIDTPDGIQPVLPGAAPPFRLDFPCKKNPVPAINGPSSAAGPSDLTPAP
jgi:phospholipid/cholesterol/gamma-HCH transport system substrate-binding protein